MSKFRKGLAILLAGTSLFGAAKTAKSADIHFSLALDSYNWIPGTTNSVTAWADASSLSQPVSYLDSEWDLGPGLEFIESSYPVNDFFQGRLQPDPFTLDNHPGYLAAPGVIRNTRNTVYPDDEGPVGRNAPIGKWGIYLEPNASGSTHIYFGTGVGGSPGSKLADGIGSDINIVPDPSSYSLAALGIASLASLLRRRR